MERKRVLRRRIRALTWMFIIGLVLSGATAIPLASELDLLNRLNGADELIKQSGSSAPTWSIWLTKVHASIRATATDFPFLFYGTDWLAFGHFVIALAFIGALRDPVRNIWLFDFGVLACALVIPYALVFGAVRGIPFWWRLIDCSFGLFGSIPVLFCKRWAMQLEQVEPELAAPTSGTRLVNRTS